MIRLNPLIIPLSSMTEDSWGVPSALQRAAAPRRAASSPKGRPVPADPRPSDASPLGKLYRER